MILQGDQPELWVSKILYLWFLEIDIEKVEDAIGAMQGNEACYKRGRESVSRGPDYTWGGPQMQSREPQRQLRRKGSQRQLGGP